jgi:hypothetical protein
MISAARAAVAVARREWRIQLGSALGWSVMAAFAALAGTVFAVAVFRSGAPATLRGTFIALGWAVLLVAPALSMRSVAEERRTGTWASLAASPAGYAAIVLGKFAALLALLAVTIAVPVAAQLAALEWYARPDYLEAATGVLGLLLAGAAYLASGILVSALVGNQVAAYLVTAFLWLTWIALARSAPAVLPGQWAYLGFSLDPLRRLDDFLLGLLDTGNACWFAAVAAWFLFAACVAAGRAALPAAIASRGRIAVGLALAAVAAAAVAGAADAPAVRASADMTKTRAFTLGQPTAELLAELEGPWRIDVFLSGPPPAIARQVDEVLARIAEAAGPRAVLSCARIDPQDPADAARLDQALEAVQARDAAAAEAHAAAIRAGLAAFDRLSRAASARLPQLEDLAAGAPADEPLRTELDSMRAAFAQLLAQRPAFDRSLAALRTAGEARPFPDEARAAAAVAANLKHWSEQLVAAARALDGRPPRAGAYPALDAWKAPASAEFTAVAKELRSAQDALDRLPRLWGSDVGAALAAGDCAVVSGPAGIATVPAWQLVSGAGGGSVAFDRRFRGEQAIASAVRALRGGAPPVAVFVHAGPPGLLRQSADGNDFAAAADALRSARFDVREWVPGQGPRPATSGVPIAWLIVPPAQRDAVQASPAERELLSAARRLVAEDQPVLLTVGPSLLPVLGQQDPWASLLEPRGLVARTGRTVLELVPVGPSRAEVSVVQVVQAGNPASAIGRAIDGQQVRLDRAVPIEPSAAGAEPVLSVEPSGERWVEDDWRRDRVFRTAAPASKRLREAVAVVAASDRDGAARAVLVGSPTWLTTAVADAADAVGGGRAALRNPGNRDLAVDAAAWIVGREDLMVGSSAGREVARLPRLAPAALVAVGTLEAFAVPAVIALLGGAIVAVRRTRT